MCGQFTQGIDIMGCTSSKPSSAYEALGTQFERISVADSGAGRLGDDPAFFGVTRLGMSAEQLNEAFGVDSWGRACLNQCTCYTLRLHMCVLTSATGKEVQFAFLEDSQEIPHALERFIKSSPLEFVDEHLDYPTRTTILTYKVGKAAEDPVPAVVEHFKTHYANVRRMIDSALAPSS